MGQEIKAVFEIDIETCSKCGGDVRIIASIKDPADGRPLMLSSGTMSARLLMTTGVIGPLD